MKVIDIAAVSEIAHRQKDVFVVVDNTFESAYFQVLNAILTAFGDLFL